MIVNPPEVIAVGHGSEGAVQRQDFQSVPGQVEVTNNLRTKEGDHVRTNRELESGEDFLGDGRAAHDVAPLQHHYFFSRASKVGGIHQAVMSTANYDDVKVGDILEAYIRETIQRTL